MRSYDVIEEEGAKIVKLYPEGTPRKEVEDELRYTKIAMDLGLEVPFMHEVVEKDGRVGILMDKVIGPTYLEWMMRNPMAWQKLSRYFAFEQHEMHLHRAPELPPLKEKLTYKVQAADLPDEVRSSALGVLEKLPIGDTICNGNYTPLTIVVSLDGPKVMEWSDAAKGYYLGDVARTCLLLELSSLRAGEIGLSADQVNMMEKLRAAYVYEMMKIGCIGDAELNQWMVPVAAAKVADNVPGEREILFSIIRRSLR